MKTDKIEVFKDDAPHGKTFRDTALCKSCMHWGCRQEQMRGRLLNCSFCAKCIHGPYAVSEYMRDESQPKEGEERFKTQFMCEFKPEQPKEDGI